MYRIEDIYDGQVQQVIVLTREELGDLHHLIDVQFMAESDDHEKSMSSAQEENEVLDTPSIADMLDKQAIERKQEEINNEMAWDDHKNKWST